MPEQLPKSLKTERIHRLKEVEEELRDQYFATLRGKNLRVLVETPLEEGRYVGTSCRYAPVELTANAEDVGRFVDIEAGEVREGRIVAKAVS